LAWFPEKIRHGKRERGWGVLSIRKMTRAKPENRNSFTHAVGLPCSPGLATRASHFQDAGEPVRESLFGRCNYRTIDLIAGLIAANSEGIFMPFRASPAFCQKPIEHLFIRFFGFSRVISPNSKSASRRTRTYDFRCKLHESLPSVRRSRLNHFIAGHGHV
jgi:hypothetical protein